MELDNMTEGDLQFMSSNWSKRSPREDLFLMHLKFIKAECDMNRKLIPCHLNIKYGSSKREKYDVYGSDLEDDAPIYIHIHGGFWQTLDKDLSCYMAKPLHDNDYKVIIVGYDLCPEVTVPQIMAQIETAVTKIIAYARRLGTKAIYMGGHSAGAHLLSTLYHRLFPSLPSIERVLIKELFLISGLYDLVPLINTTKNNKLQLDVETARDCSPMFMDFSDKIDASDSTVINIFVGNDDTPTFKAQSREYFDKLRQLGLKVKLKIMDDYDHFEIVEKMSDEEYEIVKMILKKEP